ncbi:hypothetical protein GCM10020295_76170 [Streptomyces cinereospinus]
MSARARRGRRQQGGGGTTGYGCRQHVLDLLDATTGRGAEVPSAAGSTGRGRTGADSGTVGHRPDPNRLPIED